MTDYRTLRDSDWLGQWDLEKYGDKGINVTIKAVHRYKPEREQKKKMADGSYRVQKSKRIAIEFERCEKQWLAGPVTQEVIASAFGKDYEKWSGQTLNLYVDHKVEMGGKVVGGIRCRRGTGRGQTIQGEPVDQAKQAELDAAAGRSSAPAHEADTQRQPGED